MTSCACSTAPSTHTRSTISTSTHRPCDRRSTPSTSSIYPNLNNGVYEAGFSQNQAAYERACAGVFAVLDELEERLASSRYLVSDTPTEADWRLFPTLVRFDTVYYLHFNCNVRRIVDYPSLWGYARDLYQLPGIAATVDMAQIKRHYYTTHDMINPNRIIPAGPELDFSAPHGRA